MKSLYEDIQISANYFSRGSGESNLLVGLAKQRQISTRERSGERGARNLRVKVGSLKGRGIPDAIFNVSCVTSTSTASGRIMPMAAVRNNAFRLVRPPAPGFIFLKRGAISKYGIHDAPRLLYAVVARKQRRIASDRVAQ